MRSYLIPNIRTDVVQTLFICNVTITTRHKTTMVNIIKYVPEFVSGEESTIIQTFSGDNMTLL